MKKEQLDYKRVHCLLLKNHPIVSHYLQRIILLFLLSLTFSFSLTAQMEKSKSVEKTFELGKDGSVGVDHRYGLLKVTQSDDGKVHLNARLRIEGTNEKDIQRTLEQFEIDINEFGNRVTIETDLSIKNWHTRNGRTNITFNNGTKVKGLKKFTVEMLLAIPDLKSVSLKNKYEDIILDHDFKGDAEIEIYDGDFRAKNIAGDLELNAKYGKAILEDIGNGDITLYDGEMEMESGEKIKISSKYSEFTVGDTESLEISAYDDKFEIGNVKGRLEITDKYSEIELGNFGEADFDIYDADIDGKKGGKLTIQGSKYSKYRFAELTSIDIDESYDDEFILRNMTDVIINRTKYTEFSIGELSGDLKVSSSHDDKFVVEALTNLLINESKYTEFEVGELSGQVDLLDSHDDKLDIRDVEKSFKGLKLDGKYTKVYMDIPSSIKYEIDVDMNYGGIEYPEDAFENQYYKEKGEVLAVKGKMIGAGTDAPKVEVRGHDCKVDLN